MYKKKLRILVAIVSLMFALTTSLVLWAAISEFVNEAHNATLYTNQLQVKTSGSYSDFVKYNDDASVTVNNYKNGFDLLAITSDSSNGFKVYTYNPDDFSGDLSTMVSGDGFNVPLTASLFTGEADYYLLAVLYSKYNSYANSYEDLALLNSEYRHSVVNDDLSIGNVTDFYNSIGDYIGSTSYDIKNKIYDYKGNQIKSITDGVNTYTSFDSTEVLDLSQFHRNDFYTQAGAITTTSVSVTSTSTSLGLYDSYGRSITQVYVYNNGNFDNIVVSSKGVTINGKPLSAAHTVDLTTAYYENGIVVDDAYNSKTFKNIYILNDITVRNDLELILPCNIHLLNNNITVSKAMSLKHYYSMNYVIDSQELNVGGTKIDDAGVFVEETSATTFAVKTPNANATISTTLTSCVDTSSITDKSTLLDDVLDFAQSYFVDYILVDQYYQVPSSPKKLVSYDYIDIFQGLYYYNSSKVLTAIETVTDDAGTEYTIEYDGYAYNASSSYLPVSVTVGDVNNYTWKIVYTAKGTIDYIYRAAEIGETPDATIQDEYGTDVDVIYYDNDISYIIDMRSKARYYTLFLTNPVLPTSFYDENITISYYFADENWESTDETFHVYKETDNVQTNVLIIVSDGTNEKTAEVNAWLMGTSEQAVLETVALKLEVDINRGFASESTTSILINYETIKDIYGTYDIQFTDTGHAEYKKVSLEVPSEGSTKNADFIKVTRNSYSLTDGFGELIAYISSDGTYASASSDKTIYVQLRKISEAYYDELIKNEIGQIYFNDTRHDNPIPNEADLDKYNVKTITYTPKVSYDNGITFADFTGVEFRENPDGTYYLNSSISTANNYELYVLVTITLNDDYVHTLYTDRIVFATGTSGGDGENSYIGNLFEADFAVISQFIGLSNPMSTSEATLRFYMELASDNTYVDIYSRYAMSTTDNTTIASINGSKSASIDAGTYFYLDEDLTRHEITVGSLIAGSTIPVDNSKKVTVLYKELDETTPLVSTTNIVFLTDSANISTESNNVDVYAYITDSGSSNGAQIKAAYNEYSKYDLFTGLYNSKGAVIKEITDGKITYTLTYNSSNVVTNVKKVEDGVAQNYSSSCKIDLSGFYYNNYVSTPTKIGETLNLENGVYSEDKYWTPVTEIVHNGVTYTITYDSDNQVTNVTASEEVSTYIITINDSFINTYGTLYKRALAEQTTFYTLIDEETTQAITMYRQKYSFTVPGIYQKNHFIPNVTTYDLYSKISEYYEEELFDEINGSNYYLLSSTVESATKLVLDLTGDPKRTLKMYPVRLGYFKNLQYLEIVNATFDAGSYNNLLTNSGKVDGVTPYIMRNSLKTLILKNCNTNQSANDYSFAKLLNLTHLEYTGMIKTGTTKTTIIPTLYRRLEYLDLSNNAFTSTERLLTCTNLKYLDLRNNQFNTFTDLVYNAKGETTVKTLETLYIAGNTVSSTVTFNKVATSAYGTPTYDASGNATAGLVNVSTLLQLLDNNPNLKLENGGTNDFENDNLNSYKIAGYVINSFAHLSKYSGQLYLDLAPIYQTTITDLKGNTQYSTVSAVGYCATTTTSFTMITLVRTSTAYNKKGLYYSSTSALSSGTSYKAIIAVNVDYTPSGGTKTSKTIYREIHFVGGALELI